MADGEWGVCPTCSAKVKRANLSRHVSRVHNDPELAKQFPIPRPEPQGGQGGGALWKLGVFAVAVVLFLAAVALVVSPSGPGTLPNGGENRPSEPSVGLAVGDSAPDFTLAAVEGPQFSLSQFRGRPVVLTFMAAWCGSCKLEANQIKAIHDEYAAKGVLFISVDMDPYSDTESALRQFKAEYGGGPDHIFAMDSAKAGVSLSYQATFDATWIIDQSGIIVFTDRAVTPQSTFTAYLDKLV